MRQKLRVAGWSLLGLAVLVLAAVVAAGAFRAHGDVAFNRWVGWATIAAMLTGALSLVLVVRDKVARSVAGKIVPPFMVPMLPSAFVERQSAGLALVEALTSGQGPRTVAVVGPGGFGKSTLAKWACHQARVRECFPDGVLWVQLSRRDGIAEYTLGVLADFINRLTGTQVTYGSVQVAADAFAAALGERRVLLILDGVWRMEDAQWFLTGGAQCTRLLTSQQRLPIASDEISIASMTRYEADMLLRHSLPAASGDDFTPLLDRAAGCPLVIVLLNGLLRSLQGLPLADAIEELAARLDRNGAGALDELSDTGRTLRVRQTLEASLAELAATAPGGQEALDRYASLSAFPAGAVIPYSLLARLWASDSFEVHVRCQHFLNRSLIISADSDGIRLHDIIVGQVRRLFPGGAARTSRDLLDVTRPASGWHALAGDLRRDLANQLAYHLIQAERTEELGRLLRDFRYLISRLSHDGLVPLEADLGEYIAAAGDDSESACLLLGLLRRDAHLLHTGDMHEHDLALTFYSRLLGRFRAEHLQEALPDHGLVLEQPPPDDTGPRLARSLRGHHGQVSCVAWQADGLLVSVGGDDGTVRCWDPDSGAQDSELRISSDLILRAWLSPDSRHLAVIAYKNPAAASGWPTAIPLRIQVINTASGATVAAQHLSVKDLLYRSKFTIAWAPDSSALAISSADKIQFWSPFRKRLLHSLPVHGPLQGLSWHPVRGLAGVTWYGSVIVWPSPLTSDRNSSISLWGENAARMLAWSPDGNRIAVALDDTLYMVEIGQEGNIRGGRGGVIWFSGSPAAITWRPDSRALAVAWNGVCPGDGSMVSLWDVTSPALWDIESQVCPFSVIDARYAGVLGLSWQPSGRYVATAYTDSTARLWDLEKESLNQTTSASEPAADRFKHPALRALAAIEEGEGGSALISRLPDSAVIITSYDENVAWDRIPWVMEQQPEREIRIVGHVSPDLAVTVEWDGCIRQTYTSAQACQDWSLPAKAAIHTFDFTDLAQMLCSRL